MSSKENLKKAATRERSSRRRTSAGWARGAGVSCGRTAATNASTASSHGKKERQLPAKHLFSHRQRRLARLASPCRTFLTPGMRPSLRASLAGLTLTTLSSVLGPPPAATVGQDVVIRSAGRSKGLGAFAARDLPAAAYLGRYTGRALLPAEATDAVSRGETTGAYFARMKGGPFGQDLVFDAEDSTVSGWPRFINHSKRRANCKNIELRLPFDLNGVSFGRVPLGLYIQTTRDIAAGEELLVDYGPDYWTSRGLAPGDPRRLLIDYL